MQISAAGCSRASFQRMSRPWPSSPSIQIYRAVGATLKAREEEELTQRLEELETLLEQQKGERRYGA